MSEHFPKQAPPPTYGNATASITIGGTSYLYDIGGINNGTESSGVYKSVIGSNGTPGAFSTGSQAQLPQTLQGATAFTAQWLGGNYIFVIGGSHTGTLQSTVYETTISASGDINGTWSTTGQAQLPVATAQMAMDGPFGISNGYGSINLIGGVTGSGASSTVYYVNISVGGGSGIIYNISPQGPNGTRMCKAEPQLPHL